MAQNKTNGRKFNAGRQGEQLLNEEWHSLFMALKYLNYTRYEDKEYVQERQTVIPDHALRIKTDKDIDLLQVYYPDYSEGLDSLNNKGTWKNLFEGFYHPINTMRPDDGIVVAPYQLCIDPYDDYSIKYYKPDEGWVLATAGKYEGTSKSYNGMNFQFIHPLEKVGDWYPVPFTYYGKLFENENFIPSIVEAEEEGENDYDSVNDCAIIYKDSDKLSWIHVNASRLVRVDKRLIELQKNPNKSDYRFIGITSTQTEFYLFKADHRKGKLLIKDVDYKDTKGGIVLEKHVVEPEENKYLYTITYIFDETPSNEGSLIRKTHKVNGENEVYIGAQLSEDISLFLDGLSLEEKDEEGNFIYKHDESESTIKFMDPEDAKIINEMQMTVLVFPERSEEFELTNTSVKDTTENSVTITVPLREDQRDKTIEEWKTPMVFCSGLGLQETEIFEDVIIKGNDVTIKGLVLPGNEMIKGYVADVGDSFICKGVLDKPYIEHENIKEGTNYTVFVNGILLTPTNRDLTVKDIIDDGGNRIGGRIDINNAEDVEFDNLDYVVFEIEDDNDDKIALIFDDSVSYYSIRIDDDGATATYNDCNCALLYVQDGILLDQAAVEKPINPREGYYKSGQLIRVPKDDYGNYDYYKYDYTEQTAHLVDKQTAFDIDYMIGYYATPGSIHLLGNNMNLEGETLVYYAYNYANMIDEVTNQRTKDGLKIPVVSNKKETYTYDGSAERKLAWRINRASLSTYINGIMIENTEVESPDSTDVTRYYTLTYPKLNLIQNDYYGELNILNLLNEIYNIYVNKTKNKPEKEILKEDCSKWELKDGSVFGDCFPSLQLCQEALQLAIYMNRDMQNEKTTYAIEKIERGEAIAAYRDFIYLETPTSAEHGQIYRPCQDTIEADFLLVPGTVNVYLNGVLLDYDEYCKFDNNKIMFNVNVCGLQQLPSDEKMYECLPEELDVFEKADYRYLYTKPQVLRLIDDKPYYIPTTNRDTILVEKRVDMSIKSVTYEVLVTSYNSLEFSQDYYDIPESLSNTSDLIKIYINGVYYDGEYTLTNKGGIRGIKLLDKTALVIDPVYEYFTRYPDKADEYIKTYGYPYQRVRDKITFEWR